jgi:hypothetical protein
LTKNQEVKEDTAQGGENLWTMLAGDSESKEMLDSATQEDSSTLQASDNHYLDEIECESGKVVEAITSKFEQSKASAPL